MKKYDIEYTDTYDNLNNYTGREKSLVESPGGEFIKLDKCEQVIKWNKVEDGLPNIGKNNIRHYLVKVDRGNKTYFTWIASLVSDNSGKVGWDCFSSGSIIEYAELPEPKESLK